jgi:hypothetical protein
MGAHNMQCPLAAIRLLHSGLPATIEHKSKFSRLLCVRFHPVAVLAALCSGLCTQRCAAVGPRSASLQHGAQEHDGRSRLLQQCHMGVLCLHDARLTSTGCHAEKAGCLFGHFGGHQSKNKKFFGSAAWALKGVTSQHCEPAASCVRILAFG